MTLTRAALDTILQHAERCAPNEACGLVFTDTSGRIVAIPIANAAEQARRDDPARYTRDAQHGYVMDAEEQLRAMREAEAKEQSLAAVYHSHVDVGAYFSAEDKGQAAPDGEPLMPGVTYLVVDVQEGRALGAKAFAWNSERSDFVEVPLTIK